MSERISFSSKEIGTLIAAALEGMAAELERHDQRVWTTTEVVEILRKGAKAFSDEAEEKIEAALRGLEAILDGSH